MYSKIVYFNRNLRYTVQLLIQMRPPVSLHLEATVNASLVMASMSMYPICLQVDLCRYRFRKLNSVYKYGCVYMCVLSF